MIPLNSTSKLAHSSNSMCFTSLPTSSSRTDLLVPDVTYSSAAHLSVTLTAPSFLSDVNTTLSMNAKACQKTVEIDVIGGFYADHYYSCVITALKNRISHSAFVRLHCVVIVNHCC